MFLFLIGDAFSLNTSVSTTVWHRVGLACSVEPCRFNSVGTELDPHLLPSLLSLALTGILLPVSKSQQHLSKVYLCSRE